MTLATVLLVLGGAFVWRGILPFGHSVPREFAWAMIGLMATLMVTTLARYDSPGGALASLPFVLGGPAVFGWLAISLSETWPGSRLKALAFSGQAVLLITALLPQAH